MVKYGRKSAVYGSGVMREINADTAPEHAPASRTQQHECKPCRGCTSRDKILASERTGTSGTQGLSDPVSRMATPQDKALIHGRASPASCKILQALAGLIAPLKMAHRP